MVTLCSEKLSILLKQQCILSVDSINFFEPSSSSDGQLLFVWFEQIFASQEAMVSI